MGVKHSRPAERDSVPGQILFMTRRVERMCQSTNSVNEAPAVGLRRRAQLSLRRSLDNQLYASITRENLENLRK